MRAQPEWILHSMGGHNFLRRSNRPRSFLLLRSSYREFRECFCVLFYIALIPHGGAAKVTARPQSGSKEYAKETGSGYHTNTNVTVGEEIVPGGHHMEKGPFDSARVYLSIQRQARAMDACAETIYYLSSVRRRIESRGQLLTLASA